MGSVWGLYRVCFLVYHRQNNGLVAYCEECTALTKATDWSFNNTDLYLKGTAVLRAEIIWAEPVNCSFLLFTCCLILKKTFSNLTILEEI